MIQKNHHKIERPIIIDKLDIKKSYDLNNVGIIPLCIRLPQMNEFFK